METPKLPAKPRIRDKIRGYWKLSAAALAIAGIGLLQYGDEVAEYMERVINLAASVDQLWGTQAEPNDSDISSSGFQETTNLSDYFKPQPLGVLGMSEEESKPILDNIRRTRDAQGFGN